jgi:hypothetical protein
MSNLDLATYVENLLATWFGSDTQPSAVAIQNAVQDAGYNPKDLSNLDMKAVYQNACQHPGVPADYQNSADNYDGPPDVEHVIRQIQQVTEVHNFNQQIVDNSTNIDNSVNLDNVGVNGNLTLTNNPITATDGGVAAGGNVTGAATGDHSNATGAGDINQADGHSTLIDGNNFGQANSGDNVAQVNQGGGLFGQPTRGVLTDDLGRQLHPVDGGTAPSPVNINIGGGTQQVSDVHGNGNLTQFGSGDPTNLAGATVDNSAVGHNGVANLNNDTLDHSQFGVAGGDQSQGYEDNSAHLHSTFDNHGEIFDSPVNDGQGDQDVHHGVDHHIHPLIAS